MDKLAAENKEEDELSIPRAALNKMIKELIPNIRVANDARELILNCCTEFIHLVSSEANEICNKQSKKTISPEHIIAGKFISCSWFDEEVRYFLLRYGIKLQIP
jgi:histone H3/H4